MSRNTFLCLEEMYKCRKAMKRDIWNQQNAEITLHTFQNLVFAWLSGEGTKMFLNIMLAISRNTVDSVIRISDICGNYETRSLEPNKPISNASHFSKIGFRWFLLRTDDDAL